VLRAYRCIRVENTKSTQYANHIRRSEKTKTSVISIYPPRVYGIHLCTCICGRVCADAVVAFHTIRTVSRTRPNIIVIQIFPRVTQSRDVHEFDVDTHTHTHTLSAGIHTRTRFGNPIDETPLRFFVILHLEIGRGTALETVFVTITTDGRRRRGNRSSCRLTRTR